MEAPVAVAQIPITFSRSTVLEEGIMTATYTFDVFSSLDGYGSVSSGYWGKQGPELLDHRLAVYGAEQRMVFGANTYRLFVQLHCTTWPSFPPVPVRCRSRARTRAGGGGAGSGRARWTACSPATSRSGPR
jgi:hypothetical protein